MRQKTFEVHVQPALLKFGLTQDVAQRNVNEWIVFSLFTDGSISSGKAGKLLGISKIDFLGLLRKRGITYLGYSPQELEEEFEAVKSLEISKPE